MTSRLAAVSDLKNLIAYLEEKNDILIIEKEVDLNKDISAITKATDGGPALLFKNIKGYAGQQVITNIFANRARVADLFGTDSEYLAKTLSEAIKNPVEPLEVKSGHCQQNVITDNIDLLKMLPVPQITAEDSARVITGGITVVKDPEGEIFDLSYRRMAVDGKDWTGFACNTAGHLGQILAKSGGRLAATVNIGCSPSTLLAAAGATRQTITPKGYSEAWFSGSLQGKPVEFVKAKSIDNAWSLADAEWVLEGYIDLNTKATEGAKGEIKEGFSPLMPEAGAYEGEAYTVPTFHVTAITHRTHPIYYFPIGGAHETVNLMGFPGEASIYDICNRFDPNVFDTCYALPGMRGIAGIVLRMNKASARDDGVVKSLMLTAFAGHSDLSCVMAVDKDVDITDANDVLWAMISRMNPRDIFVLPDSTTTSLMARNHVNGTSCKMGIDATYPQSFTELRKFKRPDFPECDLATWLTPEQLLDVSSKQDDYSKSLARRRK